MAKHERSIGTISSVYHWVIIKRLFDIIIYKNKFCRRKWRANMKSGGLKDQGRIYSIYR
jgi:hypothetical protein